LTKPLGHVILYFAHEKARSMIKLSENVTE
jgi:hypothetical protein